MTATPAQVLNDMRAQARFYERRDKHLHAICSDAASVIGDLLEGKLVDGRRWGGLHGRLLRVEMSRRSQPIGWNIPRARLTLEALRRGEVA